MPAYSTSSSNTNANGISGNIVIDVGDSVSGDPVDYDVDVAVSLQSASYNFTGGVPPASATFGNNGARWDGVTFTTGQTVTLTYNWSRTVNVATDYVVVILGDDGALHTHWGYIPALSQPQPAAAGGDDEGAGAPDERTLEIPARASLAKRTLDGSSRLSKKPSPKKR